jgi:hypothetical protein
MAWTCIHSPTGIWRRPNGSLPCAGRGQPRRYAYSCSPTIGLCGPRRTDRAGCTTHLNPRGHKPRVPMIALAHQDLIVVPAHGPALAAVVPPHDGVAAGHRADGQVLEPHGRGRARRRSGHLPLARRGRAVAQGTGAVEPCRLLRRAAAYGSATTECSPILRPITCGLPCVFARDRTRTWPAGVYSGQSI